MSGPRDWLVGTVALCLALLLAGPARAQDGAVADALAARDRGDYPQAIAVLSDAVRWHPGDADLLRLLGATQAFAKRYGAAIATLTRARALAPRDGDIALALARAYLWSGDLRDADRVAGELAASDPANAELPDLRRAIDAARRDRPQVVLDTAQTLSWVRGGFGNRRWYEGTATLTVPTGARAATSGGVDVDDRGFATDTRLSLREDVRVGAGSVYLAATATPSATFRERWSVGGGGEYRLDHSFSALLDLRRAEYTGGVDITVAQPGIAYHRGERATVLVQSINLWGDDGRHRSGWALRGDLTAWTAVRLSAGAATYPDTEAGVTKQVHSAFAGVAVPVSRRLTAQLVYNHEDRRDSYRLDGVTLGLRWRFGAR